PGYRTSATVNDDEAVAAYREYVRNLTDSWRTTDQAAPHVGPKEGDACMTDDKQPGHWVREGGALVCRPTQRSDAAPAGPVYDRAAGERLKQQAWQQMVDEQREAWRKR